MMNMRYTHRLVIQSAATLWRAGGGGMERPSERSGALQPFATATPLLMLPRGQCL